MLGANVMPKPIFIRHSKIVVNGPFNEKPRIVPANSVPGTRLIVFGQVFPGMASEADPDTFVVFDTVSTQHPPAIYHQRIYVHSSQNLRKL